MRGPTPRGHGSTHFPTWLAAWAVHATEVIEDTIHGLVVLLLAVLALVLIVDTVRHVAAVVTTSTNLLGFVLQILEEALLLFIVAELLHTVAIALRHHGALDPEPFLVVGMVAAIRQLLLLTAEAEQAFHWEPEGIQLLILAALIAVMATTRMIWRWSSRFEDPSGI
jgi:uncharacterized membrane protein (DUF373 family)